MDNNDILQHYGVPGMKWGVRKAASYYNKSRRASAKAKEYDARSTYAKATGDTRGSDKYKSKAKDQRMNADHYMKKANTLRGNTSMKEVRAVADRARNNSAISRKVVSTTGKVMGIGGIAAASLIGAAGTIVGFEFARAVLGGIDDAISSWD